MATIGIGRRAAAFVVSFGIALSGLSLSTSAAAAVSCERRMLNKCITNDYWYYAGYPSPLACHEDQIYQNCPPPEYTGYTAVLKPFARV